MYISCLKELNSKIELSEPEKKRAKEIRKLIELGTSGQEEEDQERVREAPQRAGGFLAPLIQH